MFEYIFSHKELSAAFCEQLAKLAIPYASKDDDLGFVVSIPEDLEDGIVEQVEVFYDMLMERSEEMLDAENDEPDRHVAAITITLSDGRITQALIRPELMNKLLGALSFEELNEVVEAITDGVERPDNRPVCKR